MFPLKNLAPKAVVWAYNTIQNMRQSTLLLSLALDVVNLVKQEDPLVC